LARSCRREVAAFSVVAIRWAPLFSQALVRFGAACDRSAQRYLPTTVGDRGLSTSAQPPERFVALRWDRLD
jgi:hypothetical protein